MVERPAQSDCRFSFLLATMKPRPPADASGIFFRVTEYADDKEVRDLTAIQLLLEPSLQTCRELRPHALEAGEFSGTGAEDPAQFLLDRGQIDAEATAFAGDQPSFHNHIAQQ
jgi:hypothetical protein